MVGTKPPTRSSLAKHIVDLAVWKYNKTGRGITFEDLLTKGLARHKRQGQDCLKYYLRKGNIFTLFKRRPQEYFASCIRSKVIEKMAARSTPMDPTGVGINVAQLSITKSPLSQCIDYVAVQTLEAYILPLLSEAPLLIHNMHFKTHIDPDCYTELKLPRYSGNGGKHWTETIGASKVSYVIYASGVVDVHASCTNSPHRLASEIDRSRLLTFLGQIRDRLIGFLYDPHERIVPDIMEWYLTECDLNRDVKISEILHFSALKIQFKHMDHILSLYVKALGKDTCCRVEERVFFQNKPAIEAITDIFNPYEKTQKQIEELTKKLDQCLGILKESNGIPK